MSKYNILHTSTNTITNNLQTYNIKLWIANQLPQSHTSIDGYSYTHPHNLNNNHQINTVQHNRNITGQSIISKHAQNYGYVDQLVMRNNLLQVGYLTLLVRVIVYVLEAVVLFGMVVITGFRITPILLLNVDNIGYNAQYRLGINIMVICIILAIRLTSIILYIALPTYRTIHQYAINKLLQIVSIVLFRMGSGLHVQQFGGWSYGLAIAVPYMYYMTIIGEYVGDAVYVLSREQRYGYFDSRLYYVCYLVRVVGKGMCILVFNMKGQEISSIGAVNMLILLGVGVCLQCYCLCKQSMYCLMTRNLLLVLWAVVGVNAGVALFGELIRQMHNDGYNANINESLTDIWSNGSIYYYLITYAVSIFVMVVAWRCRSHIAVYPRSQFTILTSNFNSLQSQEQKIRYVWAAVRLIGLGWQNLYRIADTVTEINWALNKYCQDFNCKSYGFSKCLLNGQERKEINIVRRKKIGQFKLGLYMDFYQKFVHHSYVTMQKTFKQIQQIKYLLIFFFNQRSAQKMMLYLNRENFYDIREYERIRKQHRSSDLAAKINQMENNQIQINSIVREYIKKQKKLIELIFDSSTGINLQRCKQVGQQIISYQQKILKYGYQTSINQKNKIRLNKKQTNKLYDNSRILSEYSRQLLNLVRKQMLGLPHIFFNKYSQDLSEDEYLISQIMNQEQSLVLISAESETIGKIVAINPAASKLTYYLQNQLVGQNLSTILPEQIHLAHGNLLKQNAGISKNSDKDYVLKNLVFVVKKNKYCSLCQLSVRFIDGTMGKRWLAKLSQRENFSPYIICDNLNKIIGFNQCANIFGINFNWLDVQFKKQFRQIFQISANQQMQQFTTQTFHKIKPVVMSLKEFIDMSNYEQKRSRKSNRSIGGMEHQKKDEEKNKVNSLRMFQKQKIYLNQQKLNNLLQLSLICQANRIGNYQILGYYMIKIVMLDNKLQKQLVKLNSRKSHKLSEYAIQHINTRRSEQNLVGTQRSNQSGIKVQQPQRKIRKSNSIRLKIQNIFSQKLESQFQFHYYPALNSITNENYQKIQFSQKSVKQVQSQNTPLQSQEQSFSSKLQNNKLKQKRSRFRKNSKDDKIQKIQSQVLQSMEGRKSSEQQQQNTINIKDYNKNIRTYKNKIPGAQDINELIYINGQLQFRQNKKLQEKYQCETHPLHIYHQAHGQLSEEQIRQRQIPNKDKIYQIVQFGNPLDQVPQIKDQESNIKNYAINQGNIEGGQYMDTYRKSIKLSKRHKVLVGIMISFCVILFGISLFEIIKIREIGIIQRKKIQSLLLNSQQIMHYNQLCNNFNNYIVSNLHNLLHSFDNKSFSPNKVNKNIIKWEISQMLSDGSNWFGLMRNIEDKNSKMSDIDYHYKQQMNKVYKQIIPNLKTQKDISQLSNILFLTLEQLEDLCKEYNKMTIETTKTTANTTTQANIDFKYIKIEQKILDKSMFIWVSLISEIIPIKLFMLWEISNKYHSRISDITHVLYLCLGILGLITLIVSLLVLCVIRQLKNQYNQNMEIFSFFPAQILEDFMTKLNALQNKINNDQDFSSQIDMQSLGISENNQLKDNLLFHKKKIQRNKNSFQILPILGFFSFLLVVSIFAYVLIHAIIQSNNTSIIENWFYASSFRIIQSNYQWQHKIATKGINQLSDIQSILKNNQILNRIDIKQLVRDNKQTQRYVNFLKDSKKKLFSKQFLLKIEQQINSKFCQYISDIQINKIGINCEGFVGGFSIQDFEGYLQAKKYSLQTLFQLSFRQKNVKMFTTITKYFDNYSRKYNEDFIFRNNQGIILKEIQLRQKAIQMDLYIGFVVAVGIFIGFAIGYIWCIYRSKQCIIRPIFILVRCFPLIALNKNQSFLEWYHRMKQKQLR